MSAEHEAILPSTLDTITTGAHEIVAFDSTTSEARRITTETTLTNSDTKTPTSGAVYDYVAQYIASIDAMVYKGVQDCSTNPNYPAGDAGHTYRVSVAGKIGGASGINVEIGDLILCNTDGTVSGNQATVGAYWNIIQTNLDGAVTMSANAGATDEIILSAGANKTQKTSSQTINMVTPIGAVLPYAGSSAPTGWLLCNGQAVARTGTYAPLFAIISTTFGVGNGSTTFNVPDMREAVPVGSGTFSAVTGTTRGAQVASDVFNVGEFKDDRIQGHQHTSTNIGDRIGMASGSFSIAIIGSGTDTTDSLAVNGSDGTPRTGTTTRTKQLGLNYIIKY